MTSTYVMISRIFYCNKFRCF